MPRVLGSALGRLVSRPAMAVALATGLALGGLAASPAEAQRREQKPAPMKLSANFTKVAAPFSQAIEAAKKKPEVVAARNDRAKLATALAAEKAQLDQVFAAATTPEDKYTAGQLSYSLAVVANDPDLQRRGAIAMIESGKAEAATVPALRYIVGSGALGAKDYATAQRELQAAVTAGYRDNDVEALLAQSYLSGGQTDQGLTILRRAIDAKVAAGAVAPESWYRVGLGAAFKGKLVDQTAYFSGGLARNYPSKQNWATAITMLRETARYAPQDNLDLMRLMGKTDSYMEERDYLEYIEAADPRRFPGEVLNVIAAGTASGKLRATSTFTTEMKSMATTRVASDRASLPALERDARAANASAVTTAAAADTFLSYGDAAKAAELYAIAQTKSGADLPRIYTRLGIAQIDKGDYAAAQATLAKVEGPRKPMAQLWSIYAAQKAAGR